MYPFVVGNPVISHVDRHTFELNVRGGRCLTKHHNRLWAKVGDEFEQSRERAPTTRPTNDGQDCLRNRCAGYSLGCDHSHKHRAGVDPTPTKGLKPCQQYSRHLTSTVLAPPTQRGQYFPLMDLSTGMREVCLLLIVLVPCLMVSNRLGFGAILALISAGYVIGPGAFNLVHPTGSLQAISEVGIVLFLFVIGLELEPERLGKSWVRLVLFGVLQVIICGAALALFMKPWCDFWVGAAVSGATLAMSSTAMALQSLRDKGQMDSKLGRSALAILVVQDMAVVPLLALVPLLNPMADGSDPSPGTAAVTVYPLLAIIAVIALNRFAAPALISHLDRNRDSTSLAALAALLVLGSAVIVDAAHLPMTLGAFAAGVSLSVSPSRERISRAVKPHQTALLSLFFITVGMSITPSAISGSWLAVAMIVPGVLVIKTTVIAGLARVMGHSGRECWQLGLSLSQVGEFGFVVIATTLAIGWASEEANQASALVIGLTMVATPLLERIIPISPHGRHISMSPIPGSRQ